jgi:hypothetical protein
MSRSVFLVLCALVFVSVASAASSPSFKVTSTLDGKPVLPHRIRWVATFHIPSAQVTSYAFQIDGKTRWVAARIPAVYADGNGFLVTSWLSPGTHTFTVRAYAKGGASGIDTVMARVLATPKPPAALIGTWSRTVDPTGGPHITPGHLAPPGAYKLVFKKEWIQDRLPGAFNRASSGTTGRGMMIDNDWTPGAASFHVQGDVASFPPTAHVNRETGNSWCFPGGPGADYNWHVSGSHLTLAPRGGRDACAIRGFIWSGTWTRAT